MTAIALPATITHDNAQSVLSALSRQMPAEGVVGIDAGALAKFDSSAISVLLGLARKAQAHGQVIWVANWPELLWSLVQAYDVAQVLGHMPDQITDQIPSQAN
ncbi:STAS domain-containing protein [Comamonadaceae bacterium M7527]|nr:STAS domain-containing protein [Comamonadaceae bacterium M7527]